MDTPVSYSPDASNLVLNWDIGVVVVDNPPTKPWAILDDIALAGLTIWAATTNSNQPASTRHCKFKFDISIRLGNDPHHRVELITNQGQPVYWIDSGEAIIRADGP